MFKEGAVNVFLQLKDTCHISTNTSTAHQITARFYYKLSEPIATD
jgi:hypothetical protein